MNCPLKRLGGRGAFLLCWAWVDILFGLGLLNVDPAIRQVPQYKYVTSFGIPLQGWAILWLCTALILIVSAFRRQSAGFHAAVAIKLWWGVLSLGGWMAGEIPRGYVSAGIWLGAAAAVAVASRKLEP